MTSSSANRSSLIASGDLPREEALERIRRETRDAHQGLEALPIWEIAFRDLDAYAALLDGFLTLVRPADAAIGESLGDSAPAQFSPATRSAWLEADRRDVAIRRGLTEDLIHPPDDDRISSIAGESPAAAAGTLYVLEGSALGGRILSRRLREAFGFDEGSGGRYFHGHGSATAARWTSFLTWLTGALAAEDDAETAARAARSVFERFHERLSGLTHG